MLTIQSLFVAGAALAFLAACSADSAKTSHRAESNPTASNPSAAAHADLQREVQGWLDAYSASYQKLFTAASEAEWASNTHIVEGDDTNAKRTEAADEAFAAFTGSVENIQALRGFLEHKAELTPLQVRELESALFKAGDKPMTAPDVVKRRIAAETAQTEKLYGFKFSLDGKPLTPNEIDDGLKNEKDLKKRRAIWEASKDVGPALRPGLVELRKLRNDCVRALGYHDFFSYMASEYGMSTEELAATIDQINRDLRPLFRELHTWTRYELAKRYGEAVPDLIPAHWLPNRWGQDWSNLVDVPGFDLDAQIKVKPPAWCVEQAERFYVSLGFAPLPKTFWERSSLYPVPASADYKKNTHASAWHIDLDRDVRSLMSVEPNTEWYETTHHELGHIYYYLSYSRPAVPLLLREGANRAYHEAVGSMMGLAAQQPKFVQAIGIEMSGPRPDPTQLLLKEALNYAVFIPWSAGTMFMFEKELYYDELPPEKWNQRWWELAAKYQGIAPPSKRGEEFCDAATKTHINDDPAQYYDYALSFVLLFQLHDHIAREILHEDPHDTSYFGRKDVGTFLKSILEPGASVDWKALLVEKTGSPLSARPMLRYFEPLMGWLKEQNKGRTSTLPPM
jgi:peptidyl-dipeptidase A